MANIGVDLVKLGISELLRPDRESKREHTRESKVLISLSLALSSSLALLLSISLIFSKE